MIETIKLQAYLAHIGIASRRASEKLIADGSVSVNGTPAHIGQRIDPVKDRVSINNEPVGSQNGEKRYFLLHKPVGVVSTTQDELGRKSVIQFLPEALRKGMYPVGRLDLESEGAILLTNDGELTYYFTHPKFKIQKVYQVLLQGIPSSPALRHLERGVKIGEEYVQPVKMSILGHENKNTWLEITIDEGKKHQIRKMIRRTGYEVLRLKRVQMGPLTLSNLESGEIRELTAQELTDLEALKAKATRFILKKQAPGSIN